jgi:hypothetical protein
MMQPSHRRTLLILREPSEPAFHALRADLIAAGLRPVIQYPPLAFVVVDAGPRLHPFRKDRRIGGVVNRTVSEDALRHFPRGVRPIVETWNLSLSAAYRSRENEDPALDGRSWGALAEERLCGFQTLVRPAALEREVLRRMQISDNQRHAWEERYSERALPREDEMRHVLLPHYGARLTRDLIHAVNRLSPYFFYELVSRRSETVLKVLMDQYASGRLQGTIAVGVLIIDPSEPIPWIKPVSPFSSDERACIKQKIYDGLTWLSDREPRANIAWCMDIHDITVDVDVSYLLKGCPDSGALEPYWRDPALAKLEYNGQHFAASAAGLDDYRNAMKTYANADYAIAVLVTTYPNCWHGYANGGWVTLAARTPLGALFFGGEHEWGHQDFGLVDRILVHEVCHLFGALDEYSGSGTPCYNCNDPGGTFNIPNGNCTKCARPHQTCIMDKNVYRLCAYTQGQIGWADLFVELETSGEKWSGTDDRVWLDIGDREFELDNPNFDDRERGHVEGYALNFADVKREDIKRIGLRKAPDGEGGKGGGWRPHRIRVWHCGDLVCDEVIEAWIEGSFRWWYSKTYAAPPSDIVNSLMVDIRTGKDDAAGTVDDVTLRLGNGGPWVLDQLGYYAFNKGKTTAFQLDPGVGLYRSGIHSIDITKSEDGLNGGWQFDGAAISVNGEVIYIKENLGKWLTGSNLTFHDDF